MLRALAAENRALAERVAELTGQVDAREVALEAYRATYAAENIAAENRQLSERVAAMTPLVTATLALRDAIEAIDAEKDDGRPDWTPGIIEAWAAADDAFDAAVDAYRAQKGAGDA